MTGPRSASAPEASGWPLAWAGDPDAVAWERVLDNGLRVVVVRCPRVPLLHLRLRLASTPRDPDDLMSRQLLAHVLAAHHAGAPAGQTPFGGRLEASCDADGLRIAAAVPTCRPSTLLRTVRTMVATYPAWDHEVVDAERVSLAGRLQAREREPFAVARRTLLQRLFGDHPYGLSSAAGSAGPQAVTRSALVDLHRGLGPAGGTLLLVGDLRPAAALEEVDAALAGWQPRVVESRPATRFLPPVPPPPPGGERRPTVVHRPGSVQTCILVGARAPGAAAPGHAAVDLAGLVFGGHFASRIVLRLREDMGVAYAPRCRLIRAHRAAWFELRADVRGKATRAALSAIDEELGVLASCPPHDAELGAARRYAAGALRRAGATQEGIADALEPVAAAGLGCTWVGDHLGRLAQVDAEEVRRAAATALAPDNRRTVLVGERGDAPAGPNAVNALA